MKHYAPRTALINAAYTQLVGENPEKGGHYITVWAPRQTGKSSVMLEAVKKFEQHEEFDSVLITMQAAKTIDSAEDVLALFVKRIRQQLGKALPQIRSWQELSDLFTSAYLARPLILVIDEFDALEESFINNFANTFRDIYTSRLNEIRKGNEQQTYLLHGLALIGVRSVLGIENVSGSPFNVQRSLHIPNLTFEEVTGMFHWYERESGQAIESEVLERLYYETQGQPGLTCWFGELLTEGVEAYQVDRTRPMTFKDFERMYVYATDALPNNNLINIISKAKQEPYTDLILEIFATDEPLRFTYNDPLQNFLYMHGVIDREETDDGSLSLKFFCPYIQKGLFDYFSRQLFREMGRLVEPFESLEDAISDEQLHLPNLITRYQHYLNNNSDWLFKDAPRRADLRIREAVYHFSLYMYLHKLLHRKGAKVWPEFPTGNGQLDILMTYQEQLYGIEVKSFSNVSEYKESLQQAAKYGKQLYLNEIILVLFIEAVDEENRKKYEVEYVDEPTGVTVKPVFVETGH